MSFEMTGNDYLSRIRRRGAGQERGVPDWIHNKVRATQFAEQLGVRANRILRQFDDVKDLDFSNLPESFVLKPTFLSSSFGVMVLERTEDGFYDHLRRRSLDMKSIIMEQVELAQRSAAAVKTWIVEERVADSTGAPVPDDWKFYGFQGKIGLIHRTVRGTPKNFHTYFTGEFLPVSAESGDIWLSNHVVEGTTELPDRWRDLLAIASRISVAVPSPFVRVDMYAGTDGPVFGEFTLVPGTFYYEDREKMGPALSNRLGMLWGEAEAALA